MIKVIKKYSVGFLAASLLLSATACSDNKTKSRTGNQNSVQNTLDKQVAKETSSEETTEETTEVTTEAVTEAKEAADKTTEATTLAPAAGNDTSNWDPNVSVEEIEKYSSEDADIDLTQMDSNMVYSTVYQLTNDAPAFIGKTIKMEGQYYAGVDENTGLTYHYVVIKDALACCQQGMEFKWGDGSHKYPDEYPSDGTEVVVVGKFETYKDNPDDVYEYCRVGDASMEVVAKE